MAFVWLSSLLGASAFAGAGYIVGQRGVVLPLLGLPAAERAASEQKLAEANFNGPKITELTGPPPSVRTDPTGPPPPVASAAPPPVIAILTPASPTVSTAPPPVNGPTPTSLFDAPTFVPTPPPAATDEGKDEERPTLAPSAPEDPGYKHELIEALKRAENEAKRAAAEAKRADAEAQRAKALDAVKQELERQLETVRAEHRIEVVARASAESRLEEMGDRLARASEEAASLRHKVSRAEVQTKQLRDALQGRVRALTESEWHRRRELEETEEVRMKLKDAYERIERTSLPPPDPGSRPPPSMPPRSRGASSLPAMPLVTSNTEDPAVLKQEIVRLTTENRSLRARAIGTMPSKRRGSAPDLDLDVYRDLVQRVGSVAGLRGAALTDELGSLLIGAGDHTESLAAFGAYIRDASSRTDRLLPLEGVDEVEIVDRSGARLTTKIVTRAPSELALVVLGSADASIVAAKRIVEETLPRPSGA